MADSAQVLDTIPQQTKTGIRGAKLPSEIKKIALGGNPGREFTLEVPGKGVFLCRLYVVKNRLYQLTVMNSSPGLQRFFDSFKLIEK